MNGRSVEDPAAIANLLGLLRRQGAEVDCDVCGSSMEPTVPEGATVRIRLDGAAAAPVGAVLAILLDGTLSVHRLLARGRAHAARGWVVTHGDANTFCDAPLPAQAVLGQVTAVRLPGAPEWTAPAPAPAPPGFRRLAGGAARWAICGALEVSPRLALMVKNALVLGLTPLIWLRPYPPGRTRTTSRLVVGRRSA